MSGFDNEVMYANNWDYRGVQPVVAQVTVAGQLPIGTGASPAILVGSLTSPDSSISIGYSSPNITLQVGASANYISLSPYIVGPDTHSGFATIASAIAQAVSDGASVTNQKNIYIKPQSGGYTENLTLSDGINLVGFTGSPSPSTNFPSNDFPAVKITGTFTISSAAETKITNIWLSQTGSNNIFNITGSAILQLSDCRVDFVNGTCFNITAASPALILGTSTIVGSGSGKMFASATSGTFTLASGNSFLSATGAASTIGASTHGIFVSHYSSFGFPIDATGGSISSGDFSNSSLDGGSSAFLAMNSASNGGASTFYNCTINGSTPVITSSNSTTHSITVTRCSYVAPLLTTGNFTKYSVTNSSFISSGIYNVVNKLQTQAFQQSESTTSQATLNTATASITTLISIAVASGTSIVLQGTITAANATHTDMTGGSFLVMADGTADALVGSPVVNILATSTGTFAASFSGGNLLIRVTAPSSASYNWVSTFSYQTMISNT